MTLEQYKWAVVILNTEKNDSKSAIAKKSRITYSHVSVILGEFLKRQLITQEFIGREMKITPTKKFMEIKELLIKIQALIK